MGEFDGRTVLVTGGSAGIGLSVVRRFVAEGAHVFVTGRRQEGLDVVAAELGGAVTTVRADAAAPFDLDAVIEQISGRGAGLDVVVANAGGGEFAALEDITREQYVRTFDSNVAGVLFTVQKALPVLRDGGSVVLTGSSTDVRANPSFSLYAASKAAVRSFARSWSLELVGRGIRVNVVAPGPIGTPGLRGLAGDPQQAEVLLNGLATRVPMQRLGTTDEIADAVLFLAGPRSSFITGGELYVDGGASQV